MTARDAWGQVAHNLRVLADSIDAAIEPEAARASVPEAGGANAASPQRSPAPAAPSTALGYCPVHRTAWSVKEGGISKNGKPYKAFWKCSTKDADGYCNEKPDPAWVKTHPAERVLMDEEPPF